MIRYSHSMIFLLLFTACAVFIHGEQRAIRRFPYSDYIGKTFGEFHHAFLLNCDKESVATHASLFRPKVISIEGININVGHEYTVRAFFKTVHYISIPADSSDCKEWSCPEYDTAIINGYDILKNGQPYREYK